MTTPRAVGFAPEDKPKTKKKAGRKKGPTARVKLYAEMLIKSRGRLSKKACALAAGYSNYVAQNAKNSIEKPHAEYFRRLADVAIPDELLIIRLREGMDATRVVTATHEGIITDRVEFVDFKERREHITLAAEFKGIISRNGAQVAVNVPVTLVHSVPRPDRSTIGDNGKDGHREV